MVNQHWCKSLKEIVKAISKKIPKKWYILEFSSNSEFRQHFEASFIISWTQTFTFNSSGPLQERKGKECRYQVSRKSLETFLEKSRKSPKSFKFGAENFGIQSDQLAQSK